MKWIFCILFFIACNQNSEIGTGSTSEQKQLYTCSMHPEIIRENPGDCPICGMKLVKKERNSKMIREVKLSSLLKPTNQYVVSSIPVTTMQPGMAKNEIEVLGLTDYDTRMIGSIAAKISGRIQRLYVRSAFEEVMNGQKIMDIYSPELLTAQQNLLFLLKNDRLNTSLIDAAKEKLLVSGVSMNQLQQIINKGKPSFVIAVYSNYSGHIHDMENDMSPGNNELVTKQLNTKEGMYVQKGQTVFSVYNPHRLAALLDVYPGQEAFIKTGTLVKIIPESGFGKSFSGKIDFIEPFYREGSKTLKARVYFDNSSLDIPVGSQVKAIIYGKSHAANFLPREAVISLGKDMITFIKTGDEFQAHSVQIGLTADKKIEIISGLALTDSVAGNAQYLMDGESIIRVK